MSADTPHSPSDVELLYSYLGQRLHGDTQKLSLDAALTGFQNYYRQLRTLRGKIQEAEESLARGEGRPLDVDAVIDRVRNRLAQQGIHD